MTQRKLRGPNPGSLLSKVEPLGIGERVFIEVPNNCDPASMQRRILGASRYPATMRGRVYQTQCMTVVPPNFDPTFLIICVERTS